MIAAISINDTPVLMGDFVLSSQGHRSGLRKKVVILADNCAVAWTGALLVADEVVSGLMAKFHGRPLSRGELTDHLSEYPEGHFCSLSARFIFWVVQDQKHCFLWNSGDPTNAYDDLPIIDGSGSDAMRMAIAEGAALPFGPTGEHVIDSLLKLFWAMMHFENLNDNKTFGYAYEIVYYCNERFVYLGDIVYVSFIVVLGEGSVPASNRVLEPIFKYRALGGCSEVTSYSPSKSQIEMNLIGPPGLKSDDPVSMLKNYYGDQCVQALTIASKNLKAQFYCVGLYLLLPNGNTERMIVFHKDNIPEEHKLIRIDEEISDKFTMNVPQGWIDHVVKANRQKNNTTHQSGDEGNS